MKSQAFIRFVVDWIAPGFQERLGLGEEEQKDLITVFTLEEPLVLKGQ